MRWYLARVDVAAFGPMSMGQPPRIGLQFANSSGLKRRLQLHPGSKERHARDRAKIPSCAYKPHAIVTCLSLCTCSCFELFPTTTPRFYWEMLLKCQPISSGQFHSLQVPSNLSHTMTCGVRRARVSAAMERRTMQWPICVI